MIYDHLQESVLSALVLCIQLAGVREKICI